LTHNHTDYLLTKSQGLGFSESAGTTTAADHGSTTTAAGYHCGFVFGNSRRQCESAGGV
jgi:hypothetical protein